MCQKSADPFNGRACCMFIIYIYIYIYLILIMINYYDVDSVCLISGVGGSAAQSEKELERGYPRAESCPRQENCYDCSQPTKQQGKQRGEPKPLPVLKSNHRDHRSQHFPETSVGKHIPFYDATCGALAVPRRAAAVSPD